MPNLIISTCGTSLLTNGASAEERQFLTQRANRQAQALPAAEVERLERYAAQRGQELLMGDDATRRRVSAELAGLLAFYGGPLQAAAGGVPDHHLLICTDTLQGRLTGEAVAAVLAQGGFGCEVRVARDLNTAKFDEFRLALTELARDLVQQLADWRARGYHIVFNLTGGFKSVNGFMQVLGMLLADESVYLFEGAQTLMRIPRLPINIDTAPFRHYRDVLRRLEGGELPEAAVAGLPGALLTVLNGQATLSEYGTLLWQTQRAALLAEDLLPPLSPLLRYSPGFVRQAKALTPARLLGLNERLDQLARLLDGGSNPSALRFKALQGKPVPPCTHEFYLWSGDGDRGFGYFDGSVFVADQMRSHL